MPGVRSFAVLLFAACAVFAQTRKEFEVASIRPSSDQPAAQAAAGLSVDGSQVRIGNLSLRDYVSIAYKIRINQVIGPDWIGTPRFDIAAKLPEGAKAGDVNEMLRSLLSERFGMKTHFEMRELPVYTLDVAKTGLKLIETSPDGDSISRGTGSINMAAGGNSGGVSINFGDGSSFRLTSNSLEITRLTMGTTADMLTRFLDRPVVDMTKLKGGYDAKLELTTEDAMTMLIRSAVTAGVVLPPQALSLLNIGSTASLSDSLKKAGLSLEAQKAPLQVVVIDEMQKSPSEN